MAKYELFKIGWNDTWSGTFQADTSSTIVEDFSTGWGTETWSGELDQTAAATFNLGIHREIELFSEGWPVENYKIGFGDPPIPPTTIGTDGFPVPGINPNASDVALVLGIEDSFETDWGNNGYKTAFSGGDLSAAAFNGTFADAIESFERVYADEQITCVVGVVATANGSNAPLAGSTITLYVGAGSTLPAPLQVNTPYTCLAVGGHPDQFNVAPLGSGTPFTLTTNGNGTMFVRGDPSKFWVGDDVMS